MNKIAILAPLIALLPLSLSADSSVWKVESDTTTLYLGGTMHILKKGDFPLPKEFEEAYKDSEMLVFETDMVKMKSPATQMKMMQQAMLKGTTVDKLLTPETYKALSDYCKKAGVPMAALNGMKPSIIILTLTMLEYQKLGFTEEGVDAYFNAKGVEDEKQIGKLETVEEQLEIIMAMGEGNEEEYVKASLKDFAKMEKMVTELSKAWKEGDREFMKDEVLKKMQDEMPKVYQNLLVKRNHAWLPQIEALLGTEEKEFILVGALHLIGEDGLLQQLKKQGYKIEKLQVE